MRLRYVALGCVVLVVAPLALVYGTLRASLPQLDGEVRVERGGAASDGGGAASAAGSAAGLTAGVVIERDNRGVPTITASSRADLAYATGFIHAQDRFFQMDLSRRLAAGELSELFGAVALEQDKKARLFGFRQVARQVLEQAPPEQRVLLEAYARGVNAGLANLNSRPWEYWVLRSPPRAWLPEDSVLVVHAMWWDLQANGFRREILRRELNARLGGQECEAGWKCALSFFYPHGTQWDAPNGSDAPELAQASVGAAVPPPEVLDVRKAGNSSPAPELAPAVRVPSAGSNNWAVAGRLTTTGAALVASDMHLGQRVPIVWYHARLRLAADAGARGAAAGLDLNGVTLPGAPLLVAGSNGHIAWAFTNSYGDWLDVRSVPCTGVGASELQTPTGAVPLAVRREEIKVHGAPSVVVDVKSIGAGPGAGATGGAGVPELLLLAEPENGVCWFGSWLAQVPAATNLNMMDLERATSVDQALNLAPAVGIPHQNFVVGDRDGHIGWTIFGRIPSDIGPERANGRSPWTTPETHPRLVDPPGGRIWTANARVISDVREEAAIGGDEASVGAEYELGARAQQIRDDLLALPGPLAPADMLKIQLDDRAVFLARWRDLLTRLLDDASVAGHPERAQFRRLLAQWDGHAAVDSVSYRMVRAFHDRTQASVWDMLTRAMRVPDDDNSVLPPSQFEQALWRLVNEQPMHMLAPQYASWREFLLRQVDVTIGELQKSCGQLTHCTWGAHRLVHIQHPISHGLPLLSPLLDMPEMELPGDNDMPRVQIGAFGASERFAVSPGHEDQGYFHMPGGQSGHPLSPYYRAGFLAWARGEPLPFLPGAPEHRLVLQPQ
jgi:penicillin amidase